LHALLLALPKFLTTFILLLLWVVFL